MLPELTDLANEVLEQIAYGLTNKEISSNLLNWDQAIEYAFQLKIVLLNDIIENRGFPS